MSFKYLFLKYQFSVISSGRQKKNTFKLFYEASITLLTKSDSVSADRVIHLITP
jgi:hypothetical protein